MTLKAKYADFQQITRSRTSQAPFTKRLEIEWTVHELLEPLFPVKKGIRLLGVTVSSLAQETAASEQQLRLSIHG